MQVPKVLHVSAPKSRAPLAKAFLSAPLRYLHVHVIFGRRLNIWFATFSSRWLFRPSGHHPAVSGLAGMWSNTTFLKKKVWEHGLKKCSFQVLPLPVFLEYTYNCLLLYIRITPERRNESRNTN